ncbi:MAG TPA: hypothetical protein VM901_08535 [Bdellovibrionota bacterium]|jgi:hypothetical protein|nr:hypothetical protein [Bdellovibrionota bacterium]
MKPFLAFLMIFASAACTERPSREKFPGPQGRTTDIGSAKASQAVLGGFDPNAEFTEVESDDASLRGIAEVPSNLKVPPGVTVFVSARPLRDGGPPLAVTRFPYTQTPFRFSLTSANKMLADTKFEGMVELSIRLDQDGDPLSRTPGDLFGQTTVRVGAQNLKVKVEGVISPSGND